MIALIFSTFLLSLVPSYAMEDGEQIAKLKMQDIISKAKLIPGCVEKEEWEKVEHLTVQDKPFYMESFSRTQEYGLLLPCRLEIHNRGSNSYRYTIYSHPNVIQEAQDFLSPFSTYISLGRSAYPQEDLFPLSLPPFASLTVQPIGCFIFIKNQQASCHLFLSDLDYGYLQRLTIPHLSNRRPSLDFEWSSCMDFPDGREQPWIQDYFLEKSPHNLYKLITSPSSLPNAIRALCRLVYQLRNNPFSQKNDPSNIDPSKIDLTFIPPQGYVSPSFNPDSLENSFYCLSPSSSTSPYPLSQTNNPLGDPNFYEERQEQSPPLSHQGYINPFSSKFPVWALQPLQQPILNTYSLKKTD